MRNTSGYLLVSALVFALVALAHLWRAVNAWPLTVGAWAVPVGASWLAAILAAALSAWALSLLRKPLR